MEETAIAHALGKHEARLDGLTEDVTEIKNDVKAILEKLNQSKGSWKTITILGTVLVGVVEGIEALKGLVIHR